MRQAFTSHLQDTRNHASRLEHIFEQLGEEPGGETCAAMKGLIKEGSEYVDAGGDDDVRDAGLIGAAQRVEHYDIAAYGTTRALARRLGENAAAQILQSTLDEEGAADKKLTSIAEGSVNVRAASHALRCARVELAGPVMKVAGPASVWPSLQSSFDFSRIGGRETAFRSSFPQCLIRPKSKLLWAAFAKWSWVQGIANACRPTLLRARLLACGESGDSSDQCTSLETRFTGGGYFA